MSSEVDEMDFITAKPFIKRKDTTFQYKLSSQIQDLLRKNITRSTPSYSNLMKTFLKIQNLEIR